MSNRHPRPWHAGSEFGDGLRWPLDREARCVWRVRLDLARRAGRITALHCEIGRALLRRLGQDGRLDPAHDTIAADVGCGSRTVRRALVALHELGFVRWINRLVRVGQRVEQTSNAYTLIVAAVVAFVPRQRGKTPCAISGGQCALCSWCDACRRFVPSSANALQHGVLSRYAVLPWEDRSEYQALLNRAMTACPISDSNSRRKRGKVGQLPLHLRQSLRWPGVEAYAAGARGQACRFQRLSSPSVR